MNKREQEAEARAKRREEWIERILTSIPYDRTSAMYKHLVDELQTISDDALMVLAVGYSRVVHKS